MVNKEGQLWLRDEHLDIISRYLFLPLYAIITLSMYPWGFKSSLHYY